MSAWLRKRLLTLMMISMPMQVHAQSATDTQDPEARGGELDLSVPGGPPYGTREAMRGSETELMRRIGADDASDGDRPIAFLLFAGIGGYTYAITALSRQTAAV